MAMKKTASREEPRTDSDIVQMFLTVLSEYNLQRVPYLTDDKGETLDGRCIPGERVILINSNRLQRVI